MKTLILALLVALSAFAEGPTYPKRKLQLGKKTVTVEVADTDELRSHGLMFRKKLATDQGMLFIFDENQRLTFWMKNTLIPLSIGFFDENKILVDVKEMVPAIAGEARPKTYASEKPARYALEMPAGWFSKNGIRPGVQFSLPSAK